jgi:hypothetical protein
MRRPGVLTASRQWYADPSEDPILETQRITLTLPEHILLRLRLRADERATSISALVTEIVTDVPEQEDRYRVASERQMALLAEGFDWGSHGEGNWTRDELHDRTPPAT